MKRDLACFSWSRSLNPDIAPKYGAKSRGCFKEGYTWHKYPNDMQNGKESFKEGCFDSLAGTSLHEQIVDTALIYPNI